MKNTLIATTILLLFVWFSIVGLDTLHTGGFISKKTEARYLLEIRNFQPQNPDALGKVWFSSTNLDKYESVFKTTSSSINPFSEWYINNGKMIPRWSELHRVLDSMEAEYKKKPVFNPAE